MAVETAADLASFFEEDEFAEAAVYYAPGSDLAIVCLVIVDRGSARTHFDTGGRAAASAERLVHVRAGQFEPRRGGRFELDVGEHLEVVGSPRLDETGAIYSCEVLIRS